MVLVLIRCYRRSSLYFRKEKKRQDEHIVIEIVSFGCTLSPYSIFYSFADRTIKTFMTIDTSVLNLENHIFSRTNSWNDDRHPLITLQISSFYYKSVRKIIH